MPVIKTEQLTKVYKNGKDNIKAISNINIHIEQEEFVVITGAKGSGKSTLLHLLGGLERPSSGKVFLNERDNNTMDDDELTQNYSREISFILQDNQLFHEMTVFTNIVLPSLLVRNQYDKKYLDELIESLQINDVLYKFPKNLSKEKLNDIAIARALLFKPNIILADDTTQNLQDTRITTMLDILMTSARRYKQTLVLVSHNPKVSIFADRIIELSNGELVENNDQWNIDL